MYLYSLQPVENFRLKNYVDCGLFLIQTSDFGDVQNPNEMILIVGKKLWLREGKGTVDVLLGLALQVLGGSGARQGAEHSHPERPEAVFRR